MLTKRQLLVLKEIIRLFTESGQPVGSKDVNARAAGSRQFCDDPQRHGSAGRCTV